MWLYSVLSIQVTDVRFKRSRLFATTDALGLRATAAYGLSYCYYKAMPLHCQV